MVADFGAMNEAGPLIEDGTNENAANGILVVPLRRLRTIPRDVSEPAERAALIMFSE
jgi:hypothetical protein